MPLASVEAVAVAAEAKVSAVDVPGQEATEEAAVAAVEAEVAHDSTLAGLQGTSGPLAMWPVSGSTRA